MSALGTVVGGAETVVRALLDAVGPDGTLVAYLGWEDAPPDDLDDLASADRELVLAEHPVYDPATGRARARPRPYRGGAPHLARRGPLRPSGGGRRRRRSRGHRGCASPSAGRRIRGPHADARVVERDGQIVLLGAPLETVTLVHYAEAIASVDGKRRIAWQCPVLVDGGVGGGRCTTSTRARGRCRASASPAAATTSSYSPAPPSNATPAGAGSSARAPGRTRWAQAHGIHRQLIEAAFPARRAAD
jgi:hypothetical protein